MFFALGSKVLYSSGNLPIGLMYELQNFRPTFLTCDPKLTFGREKTNKQTTNVKGLTVLHFATPKAFYLMMDVQPFWKSGNKSSLVDVFFFMVYFWNNTQLASNYQKSAKKIHCLFLLAFLPSHCNALINQTHLETSEESGIHEGFSVFTIPHLHALAAQCHSSEIRQQSTDWFSFFLIASLPRLYWEENRGMDSSYFRCTDTSLFVRDQISSEQLAAAFISKTSIITSNWCCIVVHWDSKENCKDVWKSTKKNRRRRGKKAHF